MKKCSMKGINLSPRTLYFGSLNQLLLIFPSIYMQSKNKFWFIHTSSEWNSQFQITVLLCLIIQCQISVNLLKNQVQKIHPSRNIVISYKNFELTFEKKCIRAQISSEKVVLYKSCDRIFLWNKICMRFGWVWAGLTV